MKRIAVIDLGTNTFHLLIAGLREDHTFIEIYREREYVKLGEFGLAFMNKIVQHRAYECLKKFKHILDLFEVKAAKIVATAAFRRAENSSLFVSRVERELDLKIEIISGDEEARLIYAGAKLAKALLPGANFIMDIGGGSVEFIEGYHNELKWAKSFEVGVSILSKNFHQEEPISAFNKIELNNFLDKKLAEVKSKISHHNFNTLIGCSGTFDVLLKALTVKKKIGVCSVISVQDFSTFADKIITADLNGRLSFASIPAVRAELITVAFLLIKKVLSYGNFRYILICPYALKEGMVAEIMHELNIGSTP